MTGLSKSFRIGTRIAAVALAAGVAANAQAAPRYAGALTFSPDGVLFVGDNISGAVFAYATPRGGVPATTSPPLEVDAIDARIAEVLKVPANRITVNGMAVHPVTRDVYISVSRGGGDAMSPAIVRVHGNGSIEQVDLGKMAETRYVIPNPPSVGDAFRNRSKDWPVPAAGKYEAKARTPMRIMTIVDLKFHNGELYISGISNEEFASTLRRVSYPFDGKGTDSQIRIYHVAHSRYETRAPIRTMAFATVDGVDTLVAAYTCSPLVLIPVSDLKDGAKVTGKTIGDMGNGQPLSMVPFKMQGQDMLFVTNMGHAPRMIPVAGLSKAVGYLPANAPKGYPSDLSPEYPLGPVGKGVMFIGASLYADLLNDKFFVSVTRDAASGKLNLEAIPTFPLPMKLDQIWSEFDFKGGGPNGT